MKKRLIVGGFIIVIAVAVTGLAAKSNWNASRFASAPPEVILSASDWPSANQNFSNTRAAVDSSIRSTTVDRLALAWSHPITGISGSGAATTNPIILGNTVYFEDLKSNVYAVDLLSGKQIWKKEYNTTVGGPVGVAAGYGKIFAVKGHYDIAALDLQGNEVWSTRLSDNENVGIDIQLTVYGGTLYAATVPGLSMKNFYRGGSIGRIYALNAETGSIKWKFNTIDSDDIWGNPKVNSGGGVWYPPAIDVATNTLYWGIGNPGPFPGTKEFPNGTSRPGPNLYTGSIVALDHTNGKLLWYNQVLPHDLFDYDLQNAPILGSIMANGQSKDVIFGSGKMGKVYAFDRKTGKTLWETSVGYHMNDTLTALPPGITTVAPGAHGGVLTAMAYADGVLYVPVVNMTTDYTPSEQIFASVNLDLGKGELLAIDGATGKILWDNKLDSLNVGAATVVNDLVFTATYDGKIYAYVAKTGSKVWEYQAPGGINGWPAVKGNTILFPVGVGDEPVMLAFTLDDGMPQDATPTATD